MLTQDMDLQDGDSYTLTYGKQQTDPRVIPVDYDGIFADLRAGQKILMNDGLLAFEITAVSTAQVEVKVIDGGMLKSPQRNKFSPCQPVDVGLDREGYRRPAVRHCQTGSMPLPYLLCRVLMMSCR